MFPFTLKGFDISLRPISVEDVPSILTWINDPKVTRNFAGMSNQITYEEEVQFIQSQIDSPTDELYAVINKQGTFLGNVGLHRIYRPARNARIGIVLGAKESRGRGLGTQALKLIAHLGFTHHQLHKLWLIHYADNERMKHIASSLGFSKEGVMRDEYYHNGVFHDMWRWSLLEDELDQDLFQTP